MISVAAAVFLFAVKFKGRLTPPAEAIFGDSPPILTSGNSKIIDSAPLSNTNLIPQEVPFTNKLYIVRSSKKISKSPLQSRVPNASSALNAEPRT